MKLPRPPFEHLSRIRASNTTLAKLHNLKTFLGCDEIVTRGEAEGGVGWGQTLAFHKNYLCAEDGFYRSVGLGKENAPPISLIFDTVAPFAALPSLVENITHISDLQTQILALHLTKYNTEAFEEVRLVAQNAVIIDQVWGDKSIFAAKASHETFFEMVRAAKAEQPQATLYLKTHPDVLAGKAKGILTPFARELGLELITGHPHAILREAKAVYTVSSFMGFEAMLFGLSPRIFGETYYKNQAIKPLLEAMLNHYSHFVDPILNKRISASEGLNRLASWRDKHQDLQMRYYCQGIKRWKRPFYRKIMPNIAFKKGEPALQWGRCEQGASLEDGFIRSKGLGSNFVPPSSLVFDKRGIYYDATRESDFEHLANRHIFNESEITRAKLLREKLIAINLSKYNLGGKATARAPYLLVLGQVSDDKSLTYGAFDIRTNEALLQGVRAANPTAHILYKEHPDVSAGNRKGKILAREADEIVTSGDSLMLLGGAKEVHTLTSLGGFEAVLRGKTVYTYGLPFYAGWGLTQDRHASPRRQRRLSLDELVFLALIQYPRYFCPQTGIPCEVEDTITQLETAEMPQTRFRLWRYLKAMMNG